MLQQKEEATVFDAVVVGGGPRAVSLIERLTAQLTARHIAEPAAEQSGWAPVVDADSATPEGMRGLAPRQLQVALIDAVEIGPGATWRTDQTRHFLNNTTAAATTIYPDSATAMEGPLGDGPTLLEWARKVAQSGAHRVEWAVAEARELTPHTFPSRRLQGVYYADQLQRLEDAGLVRVTRVHGTAVDLVDPAEDSKSVEAANPVTAAGPAAVVKPAATRSAAESQDVLGSTAAASTARSEQRDARSTAVLLDDGRTLIGRTVVLAQGMVQARPDETTERFAAAAERHSLHYIAPGMPAEQPWHEVPAAATVVVQGLGANFFDVAAELTEGRGGSYVPVPNDPYGRLRYLPSGNEPRMFVGSRRGVPYRSKGDFHPSTPKKFHARFATAEWFAYLSARAPGSLNFAAHVWPRIAADFAHAYLAAASAEVDAVPLGLDAARADLEEVVRGIELSSDSGPVTTAPAEGLHVEVGHREAWQREHAHTETARSAANRRTGISEMLRVNALIDGVLARHLAADRGDARAFQLDHLRRPTSGARIGPAAWAKLVRQLGELELESIAFPHSSPRQAVSFAMWALRGPANRLAQRGVIDGASVVTDLHGWFNSDGLFLASGPPATRTREVLALIEAGVVQLIGPETRVEVDDATREFVAHSPVSGVSVRSRSLIETRMSKGKVPNTNDPLLRQLLDSGCGRVHRLPARGSTLDPDSQSHATESIEAVPPSSSRDPLALVAHDGTVDGGVLVLGIPALSTQPGSAIGAAPGTPSPLFAGADVAARTVLERSTAVQSREAFVVDSAVSGDQAAPVAEAKWLTRTHRERPATIGA